MSCLPPPEQSDVDLSALCEDIRIIHKNALHLLKRIENIRDTLQRFDSRHDKTKIPVWMPSQCKNGMTMNLQQLNLNLINITEIDSRHNRLDDLSRLKRTWLGHVYMHLIKNFPLMRKVCIWLWINFYPIYQRFIIFLSIYKKNCWLPIIRLTDYTDKKNVVRLEVLNASKVYTPTPKVFPNEEKAYLVSPHDYYKFPPVYVSQLSNAQVVGGTNLVFMQDAVICHDLYDFERDYTSEELHGRHLIDPKKNRMRLLKPDATPLHIPTAAAFLDACAPNYAHWLTEVLPRIAVFCSVEQHVNVPIIVDDGLHPNIMESLALVVGNEREIITLPVTRAIKVDTLYATSVTGYVPFEPRGGLTARSNHGVFNPLAIELLVKKILASFESFPYHNYPKKVYLRRNSEHRKLLNSEQVEKSLIESGFVIVEIEKLKFREQVILFKSAEELVGATGASFANIVFANKNLCCTILISKQKEMKYWYWQNLSISAKNRIQYIFGKGNIESVHSDFDVNMIALEEFIGITDQP